MTDKEAGTIPVYWREFEGKFWLPDRDLGLCLREYLAVGAIWIQKVRFLRAKRGLNNLSGTSALKKGAKNGEKPNYFGKNG